jgi:dipeptidyl aminopeptidase/acylaminoacyl peptidase
MARTPTWAALAVLALLPPAVPGRAAGPPPVTIDDLLRVRNVTDARLAPDGSRVVYVVAVPDPDGGRYHTNLWLVPAQGGEPLQLTNGPRRDDTPRWSPDGKTIAFVSDRDGSPQVWLIATGGGEARKLSDAPGGVKDLDWSPDGQVIAFLAADSDPPEELRRQHEHDDVLLVDQDPKRDRLYALDVAGGRVRTLTAGPEQVLSFSWSPDGRAIAFAYRPTPRLADLFQVDLAVVTVADGKLRQLVQRDGLDALPKWSPDGKSIAFVSHDGKFDWIGDTYLCLVPAEGGQPCVLSRDFDEVIPWGSPDAVTWSPDGKELLFAARQRLTDQFFALEVETGKVRQLTNGRRCYGHLSLSRDGARLAFLVDEPERPPEVHVADRADFQPRRLTTTNPHLDGRSFGAVEPVRWKAKDGLEIEGLLIRPVGHSPEAGPPLLTYVHGGPQGGFAQAFTPQRWPAVQAEPYPVQALAGLGYAVFCPNPRGSGGYGQKFRAANVKDWGHGDFDDIQAGIDHLVREGLADPDRLGIMGWSYGGYMTAWTIGQTNRFKAASCGAGVTNLVSMYGQTDIQPFLERYLGDVPWKANGVYEKCSPMTHAGRIRTPTLIQHGDKDARVPLAQAQELYQALRKNGVPVEFAVYPREGHILGEPKHQADALRRNVAWFDRYLLKKTP